MRRVIHIVVGHDQARTRPRREQDERSQSQAASVPGFASGRARRTSEQERGQGERRRSTNLRLKRIVVAAVVKSGRGPARMQVEQHRAGESQARARPRSGGRLDRLRDRIGGERLDELGGPHAIDLRHAAPSDFSARCSATLTATSLMPSRVAVAVIDWPSSEIDCTMSRWRAGKLLR